MMKPGHEIGRQDVIIAVDQTGTAGADTMTGTGEAMDHLKGLDGDDIFISTGGGDTYDGGDGVDTVSYADAPGVAAFGRIIDIALLPEKLQGVHVDLEKAVGRQLG